MKLKQETDRLLTKYVTGEKGPQIPIAVVASKTGITANWIYRYLAEDAKDPRINRIQKLYDYLSKVDRAHKARAGRARKRNRGGKQ